MTTLLPGQDTFHWGYVTHHKNQDPLLQQFPSTWWLQPPMPFQGWSPQSSKRRIMTMCLILDHLPIAVRPTPVAHPRATVAPHQPRDWWDNGYGLQQDQWQFFKQRWLNRVRQHTKCHTVSKMDQYAMYWGSYVSQGSKWTTLTIFGR